MFVKPPDLDHAIARLQVIAEIAPERIWEQLNQLDDNAKIVWKDEDANLADSLRSIPDYL
jgi:hypothetical protein